MGCGGSKATETASAPTGKIVKDPEDLHLDLVHFDATGISEVDSLFTEAKDILNVVVGWNNDIDGKVREIKHAVADIAGAFTVEVTEGKDGDILLVQLTKPDGSPVKPEDVVLLLVKPAVKEANQELATKLDALNKKTSSIKVVDNVASCEAHADLAAAVNKAIETFAAATELTASLKLKPAAAPGATTVHISLMKSVYEPVDAPEPVLKLVGPLDVYKSASAEDLFKCWESVLWQARAVASANKGLAAKLTVKSLKVKHECQSEDKALLAALTKAVGGLNIEVFKLSKAALAVNGDLSLVRAVVLIIESLIIKAKKVAGGEIKNILSVNPTFGISEDNSFEFDIGVKVNVPGLPEFPDCLSSSGKVAYNLVMEIKEKVKKDMAKAVELKDKLTELSTKTQDCVEKAPELAKNAGLGMMDSMKAASAVATNVKKLGESHVILTYYIDNVKRIADELQKCITEIKTMVDAL